MPATADAGEPSVTAWSMTAAALTGAYAPASHALELLLGVLTEV